MYEKYYSDFSGAEEDRKANYTDMVLDVGCGIGGLLRKISRFR
ncbi:putative sterol 24-C-methyltransferase [Helianthus annuus]|nr:putative sterol 24-C-methyltransferase [Helianthus annuus]